jgi:radical SAM protein with 4Fe4S-binding SPASM domain
MKLMRKLYNGTNIALLQAPAPMRRACLSLVSRLPFSLVYPPVFMIEPTNTCNGLCPLCPVGAKIDTRRKGHFRYDDFVVLVDEIRDFAKVIIMNFAGEPLLNPQIGKLVAYAESNGIRTVIGTNGTLEKSEELVTAGVSEILFSLDGATEESYRQYRTYRDGTGYATVIDNLRKIVEKKRELRVEKPDIILQFVVFKHNEHEIGEIMKLGKDIGVDGIDFKPVCINDFFESPLNEMIEKFQPKEWEAYRYKSGGPVLKPPWCSFSFHETEILWNGDVTTCCYDYDGNHVVGNVFSDGGFRKVWKSKKYRDIRRKIVKQELKICNVCDNSLMQSSRILFKDTRDAIDITG